MPHPAEASHHCVTSSRNTSSPPPSTEHTANEIQDRIRVLQSSRFTCPGHATLVVSGPGCGADSVLGVVSLTPIVAAVGISQAAFRPCQPVVQTRGAVVRSGAVHRGSGWVAEAEASAAFLTTKSLCTVWLRGSQPATGVERLDLRCSGGGSRRVLGDVA